MKKNIGNVRLATCVIEILIGLALVIGGKIGGVDPYWSGAGSTLIAVGAIFLFRQIRYRTNETYRQTVDVEVNDERNRYLAMKAWSLAGRFFVVTAAVASLVLKLKGEDTLSQAMGLSVAWLVCFYWFSYLYLRKKH